MDHTEAIQGKFTERYLLGELTPAQRDQFEDHYFDCAVCAEDVQTGAVFVDNAKAVLLGASPGRPFSEETALPAAQSAFASFGLPFQAAACAFVCLLCVVGYENMVTIPRLKVSSAGVRAPEILPAVSLLGMGARAESDPVVVPSGKDFEFELEIPGGPEFSGYLCEIRDAGGAIKFSLPVSPEQAKNTLRMAIPGSSLSQGKYQLVVMGEQPGKPSQKLIQYPISVQ